MTATRPGGAVTPVRSRFADRDEYPGLNAVGTVVLRSGPVMGPTPRVHLVGPSVAGAVAPLMSVGTVVPPISPALPDSVSGPEVLQPMAIVESLATASAETVRAEISEWKPVDPQTARAVLHVERAVEIPRGRHRTRTPRPARLSSGDATERMRRLVTMDRRRRFVMVAASILVVAGLLAGIWRFTSLGYAAAQPATSWNQVALPDSTAGTSAAPQVPSGAVTSSAAPSAAQATTPTIGASTAPATQATQTSQLPAVLTANPIYSKTVEGSCPEEVPPTNTTDAEAALTAYVDCMNQVWGSIIGSTAIRFKPASIYFYVNTIVNSCSTLHTTDSVSAMYCPMDATIYVSPDGVASAVGNRFYGAELVTHEYAHHVQSLTQILAKAHDQGWSENEYSRRIELQAHCLSFAVLNHVAGFGPDPAIFRLGWQVGGGSDSYGSVASLQYWGEKGLAAATIGDCDTFSVASSAVA